VSHVRAGRGRAGCRLLPRFSRPPARTGMHVRFAGDRGRTGVGRGRTGVARGRRGRCRRCGPRSFDIPRHARGAYDIPVDTPPPTLSLAQEQQDANRRERLMTPTDGPVIWPYPPREGPLRTAEFHPVSGPWKTTRTSLAFHSRFNRFVRARRRFRRWESPRGRPPGSSSWNASTASFPVATITRGGESSVLIRSRPAIVHRRISPFHRQDPISPNFHLTL